METLKKILLIGLGVTFILSAILKTISVYSFSQTVNSFCGLLGMDVLYGYGFPLAIVIIVFELLIGVCAFIRRLKEIVIWIYPIVLGFFTYITYINYTDLYGGIESCGCFGELIHFTPASSFYKNIALLVLSLILLGIHLIHTYKRQKLQYGLSLLLVLLLSSCHNQLDNALELAGDNRAELEKVLAHFKDDPDPLKYEAACFLIENMPYHYALEGKTVESVDSAYLAMAEYPKEQRQTVFLALNDSIDKAKSRCVVDVRTVKADYLIKIIDEACDLWREVTWNKDYEESLFFDYVLPYRLLDEPLSDWKETVRQMFPSLFNNQIQSRRGLEMEAENLELTGCLPSVKIGASKDKYVLLANQGAAVSFVIDASAECMKNIAFNYTATRRNTKLCVSINDKHIDTLRLDPTKDDSSFRLSRYAYRVKLNKGMNKICVIFAGDTIGLDYVQICAIEDCDESKLEDYSKTFCMIRNEQNGYYITFDTLQASLLNKLEVKPLHRNDSSQMVRMDYLGGKCWSVSAFKKDAIDLCMEVMYVRTDSGAPISQYKYLNGNNQKWVVIPIGNGLSKMMSKDTGLFLDIKKDDETGKMLLVQNPYTGKKSQQWRIVQVGPNPIIGSKYDFRSMLAEALRVYDVMNQFEWVAMSTGFAPRLSSLFKAMTGNCRDEAIFTTNLCRSIGMPSTIDFVPHWGNRSWGHQWCVLINPDGKATPFYMNSVPGDTAQFFHPYQKAKVFRHRFQLNRQVVNDMKDERSMPQLFRTPDWIDVTDEYCPTTDVTRIIPEKYKKRKIAYICIFDNNDWLPIYYGVVRDGRVSFSGMGRNLMYLTAFYDDGEVTPVGNPFSIASDGTVKEIKTDAKQKCTMRLTRKYPFFAEKEPFNNRMKKGHFQGANKADFSDAKDFFVFNEMTNGNWYEFPIADKGKYRYLRYMSPDGSYGNINELWFFDEKGDTIKGEMMGTDGRLSKMKETVFDNDILTGFEGIQPDGNWLGLKLKSLKQVAKLRFMPRTDGNCIEIGDKYELRMWTNNGWKVLKNIKASSDELIINNIPSNGLYVLTDKTKGQEQRIFTYEGGKQIWW